MWPVFVKYHTLALLQIRLVVSVGGDLSPAGDRPLVHGDVLEARRPLKVGQAVGLGLGERDDGRPHGRLDAVAAAAAVRVVVPVDPDGLRGGGVAARVVNRLAVECDGGAAVVRVAAAAGGAGGGRGRRARGGRGGGGDGRGVGGCGGVLVDGHHGGAGVGEGDGRRLGADVTTAVGADIARNGGVRGVQDEGVVALGESVECVVVAVGHASVHL